MHHYGGGIENGGDYECLGAEGLWEICICFS